jgi:hypothetical protein
MTGKVKNAFGVKEVAGKEVKIVGFGVQNSAVVLHEGKLYAVPLSFLEEVKDN